MQRRISRISCAVFFAFFLGGCSSVGSLGMISDSKTETDLGPRDLHAYHRVGEEIVGTACRHFILGILPIGDSDLETAMKDAFKKNPKLKADGLIHVTTQSTLYGFFPLYNVYTVTCTTIRGIPVRFDRSAVKSTKTSRIESRS
jgi:hypothetical protein